LNCARRVGSLNESMMFRVALSAVGLGALASVAIAGPAKAEPAAQPLTPEAAEVVYCTAWNTVDRAERDRLLARVWTTDGIYSDPNPTLTTGRAELSAEIAALQHKYPGAHFVCSAPQVHHGAMRTTWVYLNKDGSEIEHGMDFSELAADGRIRRVTGFFGEPPVLKP
jgi:hypothetical protein